ncbi:hypothetical protein [Streptomyces sp. NPDC018000]|uniref:hypothetical protein n=1 Tax=Streptomyces sp. NPDC018000 TaxID=3365028 RepID=UPI00379EA9F4
MTSAVKDAQAPKLRAFREVRRLAYDCAEAVAAPVVTGSEAREQGAFRLNDLPHVRRRAEVRVAA